MVKNCLVETLARNLVRIKQDFAHVYGGTSHIQEIIPVSKSQTFPIEEGHLESLHAFARNNPIYYNSYEQTISGVPCVVYEGDINKYWLNSIQHGSSRAPFSPTWICSAYILSLMTKTLGYKEVVDIGSGDGRIAYCAKVLDLDSCGIEIDNSLVELQNKISDLTGVDFDPVCSDATLFGYSELGLTCPAFFIGGLAQMGGTVLSARVLDNLKSCSSQIESFGMVFAGTFSQKYAPDPKSEAGWGSLIDKYGLKVNSTIVLPAVWTFREPDDTPYIFAEYSQK
jgi:hypothetical protein